MLSNKHKQLYTLIAFIIVIVVIGAFYYFSQIKEGARGKGKKKGKKKGNKKSTEGKITGVRNSNATTSRTDLVKMVASSFLPE